MIESAKFFGYGSLMSAKGVNEHAFETPVKPSDLTPARISGFERNWNAGDGDGRYLGLTPNKSAKANGVLLDVPMKHLHDFLHSEGADSNHGLGIYKVQKVTRNVTPPQKEDVYTLVTKQPKTEGAVPANYLKDLADTLKTHSHHFQKEFVKTTPKIPRPTKEGKA